MGAADFAGHTQHARQANRELEVRMHGSPRRRRRHNNENGVPPGVPQQRIRDDHREALRCNLFQNAPQNHRGARFAIRNGQQQATPPATPVRPAPVGAGPAGEGGQLPAPVGAGPVPVGGMQHQGGPPALPTPPRTQNCRLRVAARDLFGAARQPYHEPAQRHSLGAMTAPCPACGALHWLAECLSNSSKTSPRFGTCCKQGKIRLPPLRDPPPALRQLYTDETPVARHFREEIWRYNRALSFTSLGVTEDRSVNGPGRGPPVFRICGELCHRSGALQPAVGQQPQYAQLYVYEPREALAMRVQMNVELRPAVMETLQTLLHASHCYAALYRHAHEVLQACGPTENATVRLRLAPSMDRRRYNLPTVDEVAVILPTDHSTHPRDIVLRLRQGPLHRITSGKSWPALA